MDIESKITVCYNQHLTAQGMVPIQSLASELGAEVCEVPYADPNHVKVELYTVIGKTAVAAGTYDVSRHELSEMGRDSLVEYAQHVRERLTFLLGDLIRKEVLESITPPPLYNDTGLHYKGQEIFLASTGDRKKDELFADCFVQFCKKHIPNSVMLKC